MYDWVKWYEKLPVQSDPVGLPPEFCTGVRTIGGARQSTPPWNGMPAGPPDHSIIPDFRFMMFDAVT